MVYLFQNRVGETMNNALRNAYEQRQLKRLFEAEERLAAKGVHSLEVFLENHSETIDVAERIEKLEEVAVKHQTCSPTFYMFVNQNTNVLLEGKTPPEAIKSVMVNYAFICEALGKCVKEAAAVFASKHPAPKSLHELYGRSSVELLEFCIKKAQSYKLLESSANQLVANMASELAHIPVGALKTLCESVPRMRLYVSGNTYKELTRTVLEG